MADSFVEELIDDLTSAGIGTKGIDLFADHMPDTDSDCIALYDLGGNQFKHATEFREYRVTGRVRAASYLEAEQTATKMMARFHARHQYDLVSNTVMVSKVLELPHSIGEDSNNRHHVKLGMMFTTRPYTVSCSPTMTINSGPTFSGTPAGTTLSALYGTDIVVRCWTRYRLHSGTPGAWSAWAVEHASADAGPGPHVNHIIALGLTPDTLYQVQFKMWDKTTPSEDGTFIFPDCGNQVYLTMTSDGTGGSVKYLGPLPIADL